MPTTHRTITRRTIDIVLEETESWNAVHNEVNACKDFQELLAITNSAFDAISRWDAVWHELVNNEVIPYDEAEEAEILSYYTLLFGPSAFILDWIVRFEMVGYQLVGAAQYRRNREEVLNLAIADAEFFGDRLHALEEEAIAENRRGEAVDFETVRD